MSYYIYLLDNSALYYIKLNSKLVDKTFYTIFIIIVAIRLLYYLLVATREYRYNRLLYYK